MTEAESRSVQPLSSSPGLGASNLLLGSQVEAPFGREPPGRVAAVQTTRRAQLEMTERREFVKPVPVSVVTDHLGVVLHEFFEAMHLRSVKRVGVAEALAK